MARPKKPLSDHQLRSLMRMKPSLADTAAFFSCSEDTIERHIRAEHSVSFAVFRDQNMVHTRFALARKALEMGLAGNVPMLIFSLKNFCGWTDKPEPVAESGTKVFQLNYSLKSRSEAREN